MHQQARAVIIGSGIAGSSIAYHLAQLGWQDLVILEQGEPFSGTTSHAPGLVGQLRTSSSLTRLLMESVDLYRSLRVEGEPGFFEVGSLRLASSKQRLAEITRQAAFAKQVDLEAELIGPAETHRLFPQMDIAGVEGALYLPTDGSARAPILAEALNKAARDRGVTVYPQTRVTGIEVVNGRIQKVHTNQGNISTEIVVAAAGIWSPRIGRMAGVEIPLLPMQHQVIWTETIPELDPENPVPNMRDPDNLVYFRQDGQGFAMGGYEHDPRPFAVDSIPDNDNPTKQTFDSVHFKSLMDGACKRVPLMRNAAIERTLNGLESFTPDGEFIMGEAAEVKGFWTACGFCAHGVSGAGGVGKMLAEWIVVGKPGLDLSKMDVRRFAGKAPTAEKLLTEVTHIYSTYYGLAPQSH